MVAPNEIALPAGFVRELAQARSEDAVLIATARWISGIIKADRTTVALPAADDPLALEIYELKTETLVRESRLPMHGSAPGEAFLSQRVTNLTTFEGVTGISQAIREGFASALIAPMVSQGRCYGTINVGSREPAFFDKNNELLLTAVADLIASFVATHQLAAAEKVRAQTDDLTGCLNRRAVLDHLDQRFGSESKPSLLYIDLNSFKQINDRHGHLNGDEVLRVVGARIRSVLRVEDRVGRLGGDEFLVVVDADPDGDTAAGFARRIIESGRHPIVVAGMHLRPRLSIGLASVRTGAKTSAELLADADHVMYSAKAAGQALVIADPRTRAHAEMVATIDADLDSGMEAEDIEYHFQPIRCVETGEIMGAEALIRWRHRTLGNIPAPLLIERLEATGRTDTFTRWSLQQVIAQWLEIRRQLPNFDDKAASINLTPRQLAWPGYADFHLETLRDNGLRPQDVIVEVVESGEIEPGDAAEDTLQRLGSSEVVIALDDFGTGHNALRYFTMFPIHAIKFDRSLVGAMTEHETAKHILRGLTAMATKLDVVPVAEGIESERELALCRELEIAHGQGWHLGRPIPTAEFIDMVKALEDEPAVDTAAPSIA